MQALSRRQGERSDGGFTLVELLVVMVVLGVLAAIAVPSYLRTRTAVHESAVFTDVHHLAVAF